MKLGFTSKALSIGVSKDDNVRAQRNRKKDFEHIIKRYTRNVYTKVDNLHSAGSLVGRYNFFPGLEQKIFIAYFNTTYVMILMAMSMLCLPSHPGAEANALSLQQAARAFEPPAVSFNSFHSTHAVDIGPL